MPWDTERTRRLLLDAAVEEFAHYGPAGARVDRIARSAGVNKERLYQYYGDKRQLFRTVLDRTLEQLAAAVPLTPELADDLGEYAGQLFDHHSAHPELLRLLRWEGLSAEDAVTTPERSAYLQQKVAAVAAAQRRGTVTERVPAAAVLYGVIALVNWWFAVADPARSDLGAEGLDPHAQRRAMVELARRMTRP